jgi:hypothetical protein
MKKKKRNFVALVIKHYATKVYGGVDVYIHILFNLGTRCRFTPGIHLTGDWVGPRTGLEDVERRKFLTLEGLELRTLRRTASRYTELSRLQLFVVHVLTSSTPLATL